MLRRAGSLLALLAVALMATSAAVAGIGNGIGGGGLLPRITICHEPDKDGGTTLEVSLAALPAHMQHGDYLGPCQAPPADEDDPGDDEQTCEEAGTCDEPVTCEEAGTCEEPGTCEEEQTCEEPGTCEEEQTCEEPGTCEETDTCNEEEDDSQPEDDHTPPSEVVASGWSAPTPSESRSLFCSTKGPVDRGGGEAPGVALNLPDSQGATLVAQGLATPARFYEGVGVTCDVLPGFVDSGLWVDHVGDVVEGVGVYRYWVTAG